ncbi:MAG: putative YggU family [Bacteroidota bacterium]
MRNSIQFRNGNWVVAINAPPIDGKANAAVIQYLATILKVPKSELELIKGANSKFKTVKVPLSAIIIEEKLNFAAQNQGQ